MTKLQDFKKAIKRQVVTDCDLTVHFAGFKPLDILKDETTGSYYVLSTMPYRKLRNHYRLRAYDINGKITYLDPYTVKFVERPSG